MERRTAAYQVRMPGLRWLECEVSSKIRFLNFSDGAEIWGCFRERAVDFAIRSRVAI
jgi:hypothetical protein